MAPLRRPYRVIYLGPPEARRSEQRQRWCFQNADSPLLRDGIHFSYNTTLLPFFHLQVPRPLLLSRFQTRCSGFPRLDGTGASAQYWVKLCCINRTHDNNGSYTRRRKGDNLKILATLQQLQNHRKMMSRPGISSEAAVVCVLLLLRLLRDLLLIQMVEKTTLRNVNRLS